jgi:arylsulfatase A-like enzyme
MLGAITLIGWRIPLGEFPAVTAELSLIQSFDLDAPTEESLVVIEPGAPITTGGLWRTTASNRGRSGPNVLFLTLESVSPRFLGYLGNADTHTPNLDALARDSKRLTHAWATATHSNYAQMAILSSLFPKRGNHFDMYGDLSYPRVLLHDLFHRLDYSTGTISSQDENWQGMKRFQDTKTPTFYWHSDSYGGPHIDIGSEAVVPDEVTASRVIEWLDDQHGPWSLYVNLQATHFPYNIPSDAPRRFVPDEPSEGSYHYFGYPERELETVKNRYKNALAYVDAQIGRLSGALEARGELDDTVWVITSDHAEAFYDHGSLVTHGRTLFDVEARVPLLIHYPAQLTPGTVSHPVSHLDLIPTVLDLLDLPPHPALQGESFAEALLRPEGAPPASHSGQAIFMNIQGLETAEGVVCWPWKFVVDHPGRHRGLYHLESDPEESFNLLELSDAALAHAVPPELDPALSPRSDDESRQVPDRHAGEEFSRLAPKSAVRNKADIELRIARPLESTLRAFMRAQINYHAGAAPVGERYAPRPPACPVLRATVDRQEIGLGGPSESNAVPQDPKHAPNAR